MPLWVLLSDAKEEARGDMMVGETPIGGEIIPPPSPPSKLLLPSKDAN
jgi:hypothetical protein